jgi:hypothetical protein
VNPFPNLDRAGFTVRTAMPATDVAIVARVRPGFIESAIARAQSYIEGRLRKRYSRSIPFGASAPMLATSGTNPPAVTLAGVPWIGSMRLVIAIAMAGADGTATFTWSFDNGVTFAGSVSNITVTNGGSGYLVTPTVKIDPPPAGGTQATATATITDGVVTAITIGNAGSGYVAIPNVTIVGDGGATACATGITAEPIVVPSGGGNVFLSGSGLTAQFPAGAYALDNTWQAPTPVPEIILGWITSIVTPDVYRARGVDPQDPQYALLEADRVRVVGTDGKGGELREAADGKDGLFDIPINDTLPTAVTEGPLAYSEASPYAWTDVERAIGSTQDYCRRGGGP